MTGPSPMPSPGQVLNFAVCPLTHLAMARRKMLTELVDMAASYAVPGTKPRVRAYPNLWGAGVVRDLLAYAADPLRCADRQFADYLESRLTVIVLAARDLEKRGIDACVLIGEYDVVDKPDDADLVRPVQFFDGDGNLTRSVDVPSST